jgi:hypothetical protein
MTGRALAAKLRRGPETKPPSHPIAEFLLAKPEPIPTDPADHAEEFALRYFESLEDYTRRRMHKLGIPEGRIGAYDIEFDFRHAAALIQGPETTRPITEGARNILRRPCDPFSLQEGQLAICQKT